MKFGAFAAILLLGAILPGVAQARTHDDVMAGAFRCAVTANGRQWLDCYYGAAQPLRGQLGLVPAPAAQVGLAAAPPAGGSMAADEAMARDEVMSGAYHCSTVADDRQWLDCYYAAAQPMRAQLKLPPAPQARLATAGAAAPANIPLPPPVQFGLPAKPPPPVDQKANQVISRIADCTFDRYGVMTLKLANGQVWRQVEGDTALAKLKLPPSAYVATIKHGFFGSYNMTIKGVPGLFRVLRVT